ncbi:MAG: hypothetical protein IPJ66_10260 [Bacteroidetes bacterium]|nr:hypothetical protein [Bacteroidota bacterium]
MLSDCLKIQVIYTFNAPLTRIDPALLRKGRIIANCRFKALETLANRLIASTGENEILCTSGFAGEIFHSEEEKFSSMEAGPLVSESLLESKYLYTLHEFYIHTQHINPKSSIYNHQSSIINQHFRPCPQPSTSVL